MAKVFSPIFGCFAIDEIPESGTTNLKTPW